MISFDSRNTKTIILMLFTMIKFQLLIYLQIFMGFRYLKKELWSMMNAS